MKNTVRLVALVLVTGLVSALPASAQTVTNKKSCTQAVADAREGLAGASIASKTRAEVDDMIGIAEHLCTQANFVYAEKLLQIARGMTAEE